MKIAIVDLGENLSVKLNSLSKKLNSLQKSFLFYVLPSRPNLGNPDYDSIWYEFENLVDQLAKQNEYSSFDYVIGITHARFTVRANTKRRKEKDYFAHGDFNKYIIVSESLSYLKPSMVDNYQFLSFLIVGSLLSSICNVNLDHDETRFCLFDECEDRVSIKQGILQAKICNDCLGKLDKHHVSSITVESAKIILKWCGKITNTMAFLNIFKNPFSSTILGAFLGWLLSEFINTSYLSFSIILATVISTHLLLFVLYKRAEK